MILHIIVAGQELLASPVAPGHVQKLLREIDAQIEIIAKGRRVAVTLDSDTHPNVTYLLNRARQL